MQIRHFSSPVTLSVYCRAKPKSSICLDDDRQDDNMSPHLFSLFINDMESYFDTNGIPSIKLNDQIFDTHFKMQLFADDTVLLAANQTSLQHTLNCLADYCDDWEVDVNTEKQLF